MCCRIVTRLLSILLLPLALFACGSQPPLVRSPALSPAQLLDGGAFALAPGDEAAPVALTAINDDMRAFLAAHVPAGVSDRRKVELILEAILRDGLHLTYDNFKTLTAQEAFYARQGNCLSFTNLFVALAREAGVAVEYQAVEVPPIWAAQGNSWLYNLHINALVALPGRRQVVDFSMDQYRADYPSEILDDREVQARYHSNLGVYWMNEGDARMAFLQFRRALTLEPGLGFVWTNLGTLYRQRGDTRAAEAAFLHAVKLSDEEAANSNLARLYRQLNEPVLATYYGDRVQLFRQKNPYYLYHLAELAYDRADYREAGALLQKAIHRQGGEHEFYRLQGMVHLREGDLKAAERSFRQAESLSEGGTQAGYSRKLALLAGRS